MVPGNTCCLAWQLPQVSPVRLPSASLQCTPAANLGSASWQEQVDSMVESDIRLRRQSIKHLIRSICHDLEARCQTVETPLREERSRREQAEEALAVIAEEYGDVYHKIAMEDLMGLLNVGFGKEEKPVDAMDKYVQAALEKIRDKEANIKMTSNLMYLHPED